MSSTTCVCFTFNIRWNGLARDHRRDGEDISDHKSRPEGDSGERSTGLDAIRSLAEYLECDPDAEIKDVSTTWSDNCLQLTLICSEYPAVELRQAEGNI